MPMPYTLLPAVGNDQLNEWIRMGMEAHAIGKLDNAAKYFRRAIRIDPCHPTACNNLGVTLACDKQLPESVLSLERAVIFASDNPIVAANMALSYFESDRLGEARAAADYACKLTPDKPAADADEVPMAAFMQSRLAYAIILAACGRPDEALRSYDDMLAVNPAHPAAGPNSCFMQTLLALGPADLLGQRQRWHTANAWKGKFWPHRNDRNPDRRLKVGYVSGDMKSHSAAMIFSNVLLNHDPSQVEVYIYSSLPTEVDKDDMTAKLQAVAAPHDIRPKLSELLNGDAEWPEVHGKLVELIHNCGHWRDITKVNDEDAETLIQNDGIDILVDLAGHTNGGRLPLFTRKPAPVQVTAWGFAHGTGCPEINYFFADPVAVPPDERKWYAERIYDLPCIVTYRPPDEYGIPPASLPPRLTNGYFTFGSFSRFEKFSDDCLACIRRILEAVPTSRLYLKDHGYRRAYAIRRVLDALGVDKSRVKFGVSTSHPEHLFEYQKADLVLDPFPHGAGNVSLEVLYAGVPLITRYGTQAGGRTASSVLTAIGRGEWVTRNEDEYVALAVKLAADPSGIEKARTTLREELVTSPVVKGYAGAVEKAYRDMWVEWVDKQYVH